MSSAHLAHLGADSTKVHRRDKTLNDGELSGHFQTIGSSRPLGRNHFAGGQHTHQLPAQSQTVEQTQTNFGGRLGSITQLGTEDRQNLNQDGSGSYFKNPRQTTQPPILPHLQPHDANAESGATVVNEHSPKNRPGGGAKNLLILSSNKLHEDKNKEQAGLIELPEIK